MCRCNNSCVLEGLQLTVQIRGIQNTLPILTAEDHTILSSWAAPNHVDVVALSFCRDAKDVQECRAELDR